MLLLPQICRLQREHGGIHLMAEVVSDPTDYHISNRLSRRLETKVSIQKVFEQ